MTFREFKGHTIEQSLAGNDYFVINPIKHKTARVGMQGLSDSQRLNCLQRCFFVKAYSFVLGLRSGLVFFPADFHQLRKVVELGQQMCGGSSSFALLSFHGKPGFRINILGRTHPLTKCPHRLTRAREEGQERT